MKGFLLLILLACWSPLDAEAQRALIYAGQTMGGGFNQAGSVAVFARVGALSIEPVTLTTPVSVEEEAGVPAAYALENNYPNPFNPSTTISYTLPASSYVTLTVFDLTGRQIRHLASGTQPAGTHEVSFEASGLPSGVYVYRLQAGDYVDTKRMVMVK